MKKGDRLQLQLSEAVWGETVMQHIATGVEAGITMSTVRGGVDTAWRQSGFREPATPLACQCVLVLLQPGTPQELTALV